jgi:hypothetical protein
MSFDATQVADLTEVIAELPHADDNPRKHPVKKLLNNFDDLAKGDTNQPVNEENMKVYLRVRPIKAGVENTIRVDTKQIATVAPMTSHRAKYTKTEERTYDFNRCFGPEANNSEVFEHTFEPMLDRFLNGDSCVIFAYGMTNSGKTHTIQGTKSEPGSLPRLVNEVMSRLDSGDNSGCSLSFSMLEIYQEKVYDLLTKSKSKLNIREINGRVEVPNLSVHTLASADAAFTLMDKATKNRSKSRTLLNAGSSRSHGIYTLHLTREVNGRSEVSEFQVVDLAGAERGSRTHTRGMQMKEANNINTSLMQLWRCLQAMKKARGRTSSDIIPFRESKLCHLLMPSLGRVGLNGVAMITCINPQAADYDETLSILSNASLACRIKEISDIENRHAERTAKETELKRAADRAANKERMQKRAGSTVSAHGNKRGMIVGTKRNSSLISEVTMSEIVSQGGSEAASLVQNTESAKKLREEVEFLRNENEALLRAQLDRETEIRQEICEEMTERSQHLLERIEELQEELYVKSSADTMMEVHKSVKKARRAQVERQNAETARNLAEAEEELERIKTEFEADIVSLRAQKNALEVELADWKTRALKAEKQVVENTASSKQEVVTGYMDLSKFVRPEAPPAPAPVPIYSANRARAAGGERIEASTEKEISKIRSLKKVSRPTEDSKENSPAAPPVANSVPSVLKSKIFGEMSQSAQKSATVDKSNAHGKTSTSTQEKFKARMERMQASKEAATANMRSLSPSRLRSPTKGSTVRARAADKNGSPSPRRSPLASVTNSPRSHSTNTSSLVKKIEDISRKGQGSPSKSTIQSGRVLRSRTTRA